MKALGRMLAGGLLLGASLAQGADEIKVLTQNQYLGADLAPLLAAPDAAAFNEALVGVLRQVAANRFPERALRQAMEIASRKPEIVALQEAWSFTCTDYFNPPIPNAGCGDPSIAGAFVDHLNYTLGALQGLGVSYYKAASVKNLDLGAVLPGGIPFMINGVPAFLGAVDNDVILARTGVVATPVEFAGLHPAVCVYSSDDGCNYQAAASGVTPIGSLEILRGFVGVDTTVGGKDYRIVNTHLEIRDLVPGDSASRVFQSLQATELLGTLQFMQLITPPGRRLLVLGDMNSDPRDQPIPGPFGEIVPPYRQFADAGYTDAWKLRPGAVSGVTCCQAEDLSNHKSALYERIDLIWSLDAPAKVKQARVVGANVSNKTAPAGRGIWPSDHAGVAADLQF